MYNTLTALIRPTSCLLVGVWRRLGGGLGGVNSVDGSMYKVVVQKNIIEHTVCVCVRSD